MSNDRDNRTEDALRRALAAEAGRVSPGGDGLMNIQQRVAARDARMRWLRPAMAAGVAVVVVAAGVGGYAIAKNHDDNGNAKVTPANSNTATPPVATGYPADAIFPFATKGQELSWENEFADGHSPWASDPVAVTQSWVQYYLLQHGSFRYAKQATSDSADVTVSRSIGGTDHAVTVVHLVKYGNAWLVTGASDPANQLSISSPAAGAGVASPLTVTGPGYGVDEQATVDVRSATTADSYGHASTGPFGNGTAQWSATVPFDATSNAGVVVVTVDSPADGKVGTLTAEKVTFAAEAASAATASSYGVQGGVIERFDANGKPQGPVAGSDAHGTVVEVRQFGDRLYFTARSNDCLSDLYSLPTSGGMATTVATADPGFGIVGFDLASSGRLVFFESGCGDQAGTAKLVFPTFGHGPQGHSIDFPSLPPVIEGDPVWESDGVHVDAFVRTGNEGYLARYDSSNLQESAQPSTDACPGFDITSGLPGAVAEGPNGELWVASQTGTSMQVVSCNGSTPTVKFTVPKNDSPTALSINSAGAALLTDSSGKVWSWTPGTPSPRALSEASGVTSATW